MKSEEFVKNEGIAKRVMDILIVDYLKGNQNGNGKIIKDRNYVENIKDSLKDYVSFGYDMRMYKIYVRILENQLNKKEKK